MELCGEVSSWLHMCLDLSSSKLALVPEGIARRAETQSQERVSHQDSSASGAKLVVQYQETHLDVVALHKAQPQPSF